MFIENNIGFNTDSVRFVDATRSERSDVSVRLAARGNLFVSRGRSNRINDDKENTSVRNARNRRRLFH